MRCGTRFSPSAATGLLLPLLLSGCGGGIGTQARDSRWATPVENVHLENAFKVNETLYRGAQPSAEGVGELKRLGMKTIVNLRSTHSDADEIGDAGLASITIRCKVWDPDEEDVIRFLKVVTDPSRFPIFVHCQHGSDRTGMMLAVYRMVVEGWTHDEALREMVDGQYGFHRMWFPIRNYVKEVDVDRLREKAGLPPLRR